MSKTYALTPKARRLAPIPAGLLVPVLTISPLRLRLATYVERAEVVVILGSILAGVLFVAFTLVVGSPV